MVIDLGLAGEVMGSSHLFVIYSTFVDLKVHRRLYLVYTCDYEAACEGGC